MATSTSNTTRAAKPATRRRPTAARKPAASTTTSTTQAKTSVQQAQDLAERAVLVPVGATLLVRDNLVSTVKGLATRYRSRSGIERELKRFERRGVTARTRLERQVRRQRTRVEREFRQRRRGVERTVKQNRRRIEREVRQARKDLEKQSGALSARVQELISSAT